MVLKLQMSLSVKTVPVAKWNPKGSQGSMATETNPVYKAATQQRLLYLHKWQGYSTLISLQIAFKVKYNKVQWSS